ncbi:MAG: HAMP domain-containing histidine kinase [Oscillospiraceae bacterium]|nr:HAMP domain-containing histidine kinase [Oscillospiraceae bacterium]
MEKEDKTGMLDLIVHPAFCVKDGVILQANQPASQRLVEIGTQISALIKTGSEEYADFSDGCLYLTLCISGQDCGASVSKVDGMDVFILEQDADHAELRAMALAAKELRAPLASVMTIADRLFPLLDQQENSAADEQIARINRGLFQMLRVISNMSDASSYTEAAANTETLDICAVLDEIFQKAQTLVTHTGIELNFSNLPSPIYCLVDEAKIERAIYNILSNALKFTPKGGFINAKLVRRGNKLYLSVQDSGSGVPSRLLGSIYARFQREPAVEDVRFGIGLGMVLIRSAAALHGGTVLIDQPTGQGTRITMSMEIRQSKSTTLRSPMHKIDYAGERDHGLIELSESLPVKLYKKENIN